MASPTKKKKARTVWKLAKIERIKSDVVTLASKRRKQRQEPLPNEEKHG